MCKLWDYNERWAELEWSWNPFATVVMAHLKAKLTRKDPENRLRWKTWIVRRLYRMGLEREDVLELFRFIDWVMALPEELEEEFTNRLESYEEEIEMPHMIYAERRGLKKGIEQGIQQGIERGIQQGIERGIQQGIQQGLRKGLHRGEALILKRLLTRRFDALPAWAEERLDRASRRELERWSDRVLDAATLDDVFAPV